jgi:uncharacterized cupin superfamily protein
MSAAATTPSFIDLRAVLAAQRPAALQAPVQAPLALAPGPVDVGVLYLPAGTHAQAVEHDQFVLIAEGSVELLHDGQVHILECGRSAVIRAGSQVSWQAGAPAAVVYMSYSGPAAGQTGVVVLTQDPALAPSNPPASDVLISAVPSCRSFNDFRSADDTFVCGTWDSTPYTRRAIRFGHYELMHLLEGQVSFADPHGPQASFGAGDIVLFVRNGECAWDSQVHVRKTYGYWRPAA